MFSTIHVQLKPGCTAIEDCYKQALHTDPTVLLLSNSEISTCGVTARYMSDLVVRHRKKRFSDHPAHT